jgi:hypothetical protein
MGEQLHRRIGCSENTEAQVERWETYIGAVCQFKFVVLVVRQNKAKNTVVL